MIIKYTPPRARRASSIETNVASASVYATQLSTKKKKRDFSKTCKKTTQYSNYLSRPVSPFESSRRFSPLSPSACSWPWIMGINGLIYRKTAWVGWNPFFTYWHLMAAFLCLFCWKASRRSHHSRWPAGLLRVWAGVAEVLCPPNASILRWVN